MDASIPHSMPWLVIVIFELTRSFSPPPGDDHRDIIRPAISDCLLHQLIGCSLRGQFEGDGRQGGFRDNTP